VAPFGSMSDIVKLAEADRPAFESLRIAIILDVKGHFRIYQIYRFFMGFVMFD
jgi:hypothetical protein